MEPYASRTAHDPDASGDPVAAEQAAPRSRRRNSRALAAAALVVLVGGVVVALLARGGDSDSGARAQPPAAASAVPKDALRAESFGAVGDGRTDDSAALQRGLDALAPGQTLALRDGATYRHDAVLHMTRPRSTLAGRATLLAGAEQTSAFAIAGDDEHITGVRFAIGTTTRRWDSDDQMKIYVDGHRGLVLTSVSVTGSAAAGIYIGGGASGFRLQDVTVSGTRADGIHMTQGAHDGVLVRPQVRDTGDDGVSVVSYEQDGPVCSDITVQSPLVAGTRARGLSVVGGSRVTWTDVTVSDTSAAAVYIAVEGAPYDTGSVADVTLTGAVISGANRDAAIDHGAVLVYAGRAGHSVSGVTLTGLRIEGTRATASRQVGLVSPRPQTISAVLISDVTIRGGPATAFALQDVDQDYRLSGWTQDGAALADRQG